ncbi:unnamed protein product, partial [Rotaria sp. Silwood1]
NKNDLNNTLGECATCSFAFCTLCRKAYHGVNSILHVGLVGQVRDFTCPSLINTSKYNFIHGLHAIPGHE